MPVFDPYSTQWIRKGFASGPLRVHPSAKHSRSISKSTRLSAIPAWGWRPPASRRLHQDPALDLFTSGTGPYFRTVIFL
eukprot:3172896-Pleurochrysis_carterae.AAC.2